jgi:hypothetical protein
VAGRGVNVDGLAVVEGGKAVGRPGVVGRNGIVAVLSAMGWDRVAGALSGPASGENRLQARAARSRGRKT